MKIHPGYRKVDTELLQKYYAARTIALAQVAKNNRASKGYVESGSFRTPVEVVDAVARWRLLAIEVADSLGVTE